MSDGAGREGTRPVRISLPGGFCRDVWPVLGFVEGDIPFMEKLTNSIGHSAKQACLRCALKGKHHAEAKTVRYLYPYRYEGVQNVEPVC